MAGLFKFGSNALAQFLDAPDIIYGTGDDGSITLDGTSTVLSMIPSSNVYSMTRDLHVHNLTINDSVRLAPNGYRIFVKNLLTLGNGSIIGWTGGWSTAGSIAAGAAAQTSVTTSLGGNGTGTGAGTATAPTAGLGGINYWKQPLNAIRGWTTSVSSTTPTFLRGGAGGSTGVGGGVIIVAARYISCSATSSNASFSAPGGSAGGGGGVILILSSGATLPSNVSTDVTGNGGAASGTVNYMMVV